MIYRNPRTGLTQQVEEREQVKRSILEQAGWKVVSEAKPAPEAKPEPQPEPTPEVKPDETLVAMTLPPLPTPAADVQDVTGGTDGEGQAGGQEQPLREDDQQDAEGRAVEELPRPASQVKQAGMVKPRKRNAHGEIGNLPQ